MACVAGISAFTAGIKLEPTTRDVSSNKKVVARTAKRTKSCIAETPRVSRRTGPRRECVRRRAEGGVDGLRFNDLVDVQRSLMRRVSTAANCSYRGDPSTLVRELTR